MVRRWCAEREGAYGVLWYGVGTRGCREWLAAAPAGHRSFLRDGGVRGRTPSWGSALPGRVRRGACGEKSGGTLLPLWGVWGEAVLRGHRGDACGGLGWSDGAGAFAFFDEFPEVFAFGEDFVFVAGDFAAVAEEEVGEGIFVEDAVDADA